MIVNGLPSLIVLFVNERFWKELKENNDFSRLHFYIEKGIHLPAFGGTVRSAKDPLYDPLKPNWKNVNLLLKNVTFKFVTEITDDEHFRVFKFELNEPEIHFEEDFDYLLYTPKEECNV